jgi:hypothetical protein
MASKWPGNGSSPFLSCWGRLAASRACAAGESRSRKQGDGSGSGFDPRALLMHCRSRDEIIERRMHDGMASCFAHVRLRAVLSAVCYARDNEPCATLILKLNVFELNVEWRCDVLFA